jgi:hypothetical protein
VSRGITDQCQVRGGQEGLVGSRHRSGGPGGEQVRKGEVLYTVLPFFLVFLKCMAWQLHFLLGGLER